MIIVQTPAGEIELPEREAKFIDFKGYRGDSLLKKAGVKIEWTQDLLTEFARCAEDPVYFIETYMRVIHVDFGLIPFQLRPYQKQLIQNIHNNRRTITTMARQSGKCLESSATINIRNKKTKEIRKISIGEFYEYFERTRRISK